MNRRGFLKTAITGSVYVPVMARAVPSVIAVADEPAAAIVLHDARYSDARKFSAAAARLGAQVMAQEADMIRLWYRELDAFLQSHGNWIMGMTTCSDFMLICDCTATLKRRVIYEGLHDCRGGDTLTHRLQFRSKKIPRAMDSGPEWPETLARALCRSRGSDRPLQETVMRSNTRRAEDNPGTLVSWLIE